MINHYFVVGDTGIHRKFGRYFAHSAVKPILLLIFKSLFVTLIENMKGKTINFKSNLIHLIIGFLVGVPDFISYVSTLLHL